MTFSFAFIVCGNDKEIHFVVISGEFGESGEEPGENK